MRKLRACSLAVAAVLGACTVDVAPDPRVDVVVKCVVVALPGGAVAQCPADAGTDTK